MGHNEYELLPGSHDLVPDFPRGPGQSMCSVIVAPVVVRGVVGAVSL